MNTNDEPLNILRFWRDLEIFNIPDAPNKTRDGNITSLKLDPSSNTLRISSGGATLPWLDKKLENHEHIVYLGIADKEDLAKWVLQVFFPDDREISEREREMVAGNGWLAAFVVDKMGRPKPDSYLPASFAHGVAAWREEHELDNINKRLQQAKEEFAQRHSQEHEENEENLENQEEEENNATNSAQPIPLNLQELERELHIVLNLLGKPASNHKDWRVFVHSMSKAQTDFLNSFYLNDLDCLIAQAENKQPFGKALEAYLGSELPEDQRVDILTDNAAMAELVSAKRLPSARWPAPSKHPLVLAQQAAVSHVISSLANSEGLIGINGPPGTGKTTLLCDIIAEIVTERARRIAKLDKPSALFGDIDPIKFEIKYEEKTGKFSFFPLKAEVVGGTSIVVTSTNNNAVKNITQELPARKKIADDEFGSPDYFAEVMREVFIAQEVLDEKKKPIETWGLIAAALGNKKNRGNFAKGFFHEDPKNKGAQAHEDKNIASTHPAKEETDAPSLGDDRPTTIWHILDSIFKEIKKRPQYRNELANEWEKGRQTFQTLQAEFDSLREELQQAEKAALIIDGEESKLKNLKVKEQELAQDIQTREQALAELEKAQANQRIIVEMCQEEAASAKSRLNLWDHLMQLFGRETSRIAELRQSEDARKIAGITFRKMNEEVLKADAQLKQQRGRQKDVSSAQVALEQKLETDRKVLQACYAKGVKYFPDARFWNLPADARHRASIAVSFKLDELRGKLFLQAVELHRLTVLANAGSFLSNLRTAANVLNGNWRDKLLPEHYPQLWDAFFFVVPVVSTTFASFDRLFAYMGQNSLGWLLIDEAGQATPQAAAGAIWRSRRAVIVGDPLQVEPVFTIPFRLVEDLRARHDVTQLWSPIEESVQTLADRVTKYGAWVENSSDSSERIWTGMPLRTHRRCDDPMFSVANRIAYAGQMVQGSVNQAGLPIPTDFSCSLGESKWFDVQSNKVNHPVSEDEIACLLDCLKELRREKNDKIYVISPFRKVFQACEKRVSRDIECGTIHTFQGKEASIVFLVLGAPGSTGSGARSWAAEKPNLLNVAITRAKSRLYVIGDASQWRKLKYFSELHDALQIQSWKQSNP